MEMVHLIRLSYPPVKSGGNGLATQLEKLRDLGLSLVLLQSRSESPNVLDVTRPLASYPRKLIALMHVKMIGLVESVFLQTLVGVRFWGASSHLKLLVNFQLQDLFLIGLVYDFWIFVNTKIIEN
jgi:hypothetical protein